MPNPLEGTNVDLSDRSEDGERDQDFQSGSSETEHTEDERDELDASNSSHVQATTLSPVSRRNILSRSDMPPSAATASHGSRVALPHLTSGSFSRSPPQGFSSSYQVSNWITSADIGQPPLSGESFRFISPLLFMSSLSMIFFPLIVPIPEINGRKLEFHQAFYIQIPPGVGVCCKSTTESCTDSSWLHFH